jgi:hypothetical protein
MKSGIQLSQDRKINTTLYADDQVLIAKSEDELQKAANVLNKIAKIYKMEISETKTKKWQCVCVNNYVRAKIELKGKMIEQVSEFKFVGSILSNYSAGCDLEYRTQTFNRMNGVRWKMEEKDRSAWAIILKETLVKL